MTNNKIEKMCFCCEDTVQEVEKYISSLETEEAVKVLESVSDKDAQGMERRKKELIDSCISKQLEKRNLAETYETLYEAFPTETLSFIGSKPRMAESLFKSQEITAPTGRELLDKILPSARYGARENPYAAIDIATTAARCGIFPELNEYLDEFSTEVQNSGYYSSIGLQRIFKYLESNLSGDTSQEGFCVVPGKQWGQNVYFDGKYLGLYSKVIPDKITDSESARWVTVEVIDTDASRGAQYRISLWKYSKGDAEAKMVHEKHAYETEGLPTVDDLFNYRE